MSQINLANKYYVLLIQDKEVFIQVKESVESVGSKREVSLEVRGVKVNGVVFDTFETLDSAFLRGKY